MVVVSSLPEESGAAGARDAVEAAVPPAKQLELLRTHVPLHEGDAWYMVSVRWKKAWEAYCQAPESAPAPGPVDNTGLLTSSGHPSTFHLENQDFVFVHQRHWDLLVQWYGPATAPIRRQVINSPTARHGSNLQIEVHPPRFKVALTTAVDATCSVTASKISTFGDLLAAACQALGQPDPSRARLWSVVAGSRDRVLSDLTAKLGDQYANPATPEHELRLEIMNDDGTWTEKYVPTRAACT